MHLTDHPFSHSEFARVFGVDFRSVRTRGSQFKVESVLFKLSKPESFMMLSPSRTDVSGVLLRGLGLTANRPSARRSVDKTPPSASL